MKVKKVLNKILSVLSYALMIVSVLMLGTVLLARSQDKLPTVFGYCFNIVVTDSMTPEIQVGEFIVVKKTDKADIEVGDDILFYTDNPSLQNLGINLVIHRVVGITDDGFLTQGVKTGATVDEYPATRVVGVKVWQSKFIGDIVVFLGTGYNMIFFVVIMVLLFVAVGAIRQIFLIVKEDKK